MKRTKFVVAAALLAMSMISGCSQPPKLVTEAMAEETEEMLGVDVPDFRDFPADAYPEPETSDPTKIEAELFKAKFEGSEVSGSGGPVGGKFHFVASETDGEAWHVKLEANYPTIAGRDYYVTYRFNSDVAGTVKFGDFQEFQIKEGDNEITGVFTAKDSTSYVDLQLGMLPAFMIDFNEIEVKEYADEVEYENALPKPINFKRESRVYERHDTGYHAILVRGDNAVNVNYVERAMDFGVWKSKLLVRTGMVPEPGVHYRVTADVMCDQDMPFEVLLNDGTVEKGYGALYGQKLTANEVKTCEAVIMGNGNGDELILQFSLGEAPEGSMVIVGNVHVDKIVDHSENALPVGFALDESVATGGMIEETVPVDPYDVTPAFFSYTSVDRVYEQHDDGYIVDLKEGKQSATLNIKKAPSNPDDRGVWKAKLYAATGVDLEANKTYMVRFDLESTKDQAEYEVCFDGDTENAYGALYGRSLTAGGTDHIKMLITPKESNGPLTVRIQLGKTNTAAGNSITLKNLSVKTVLPRYTGIPLDGFSYDTGTKEPAKEEYKSVVSDISYRSGINVTDQHADGYTTEATADGSSATLKITEAPAEGREHWKAQLIVKTGVKPEAGKKYTVRFKLKGSKAQPFEVCYGDAGEEKRYGALYGQELAAGEEKTVSCTFTAPEGGDSLVLKLMAGVTPDTLGNTLTVSDIEILPLATGDSGTSVLHESFAYPVVSEPTTVPEGYADKDVSLSASLVAYDGFAGETTVADGAAKLSVTAARDGGGLWSARFFVGTGVTLEAGEKYLVTATFHSNKAIGEFEILSSNGTDEDDGYNKWGNGYNHGNYGLSIGEGGDYSISKEIIAPTGLSAYNPLFLRFQIGNSPADNTITVSNVKVQKWESAHEEPGTTDAKSFELSAHESYAATLSGDGSSATAHFNNVPGDAEVWKTKLFANTGVTLEAGKSYRISADVKATAVTNYEICYNNGGTEKGAGNGGNAAKYGLTATSSAQTVTYDVVADSDANLVIQFSLGNAASGTDVTVSNIKVEELAEEEGSNLMSDSLVAWAPVHQFVDGGYAATLTNDDSSATMAITSVADEKADWKAKLYVETGAQLKAGKQYRIRYNIEADSNFTYHVFYGSASDEKSVGEFYELKASTKSVQHVVTPKSDSELIIQYLMGYTSAPNKVKVSNVKVEEIIGGSGSSDSAPINHWAHDGYVTSLSNTDTSATMAIKKVPSTGREAWKVKLFAETGAKLEAGKTYRVSLDVQATNPLDYEICFNNKEKEGELGVLAGQQASKTKKTVTYTLTAEQAAELFIQLNLGNASKATNVTISNIKVQEVTYKVLKTNVADFSYDSVGYLSKGSDDGYITSLEQYNSSATFRIKHAPAERHAWCAKVNVRTGVTPKNGQAYRVTVNIDAAKQQNLFELFCDGNEELAYGALYEQQLVAGRNTISYVINPGDSKGELMLQLRFGETDSQSGNIYTISGIKIEEVTLVKAYNPEIKEVCELATQEQDGYAAKLTKTPERATVQILNTPEALEAWKNKLFVYTGVVLKPDQKYRVSFTVKSIVPTPFEVCFNKHNEEKGVGAIFGLMSKPYGEFIEYFPRVKEDSPLVIQLSLGNCVAPNTIFLSDVKVQQIDKVNLVTDKIYVF